MELIVPKYDLKHTRPIIGYGNFTKDISNSHGCIVDTTIVDKKFALWDYVMKNNLLESEDEMIRAQAVQLLRDKTIFMYNFMKLNGKPVKARWTQDIVLSDPYDRVLFCACNQHLGKSTALDFDAATEFLLNHGKRWVGILVSGSLPQSQERMGQIKLLLDSMGSVDYKMKDIDIDSKGKSNATQVSIFFHDEKTGRPLHSNILICCPHTSTALGYPADNIWPDEVDFWEDVKGGQIHFFNQVLDPRTYFTEGKIKGYSNPNGKERMMWYLWNQKDKRGVPFWHRYHFNYWDKPNPSQENFDRSCIGKTRNEIESTLLAAFTTQEGAFLTTEGIKDLLCPELSEQGDQAGYGRECAFFLDVGAVHDQSCLIGAFIEPNPEVPEIPLIKEFYIHKYPVGYPIGRVVGIEKTVDPKTGKVINMNDLDDDWQDYTGDNPSVKETLAEYADVIDETKYQPLFGFDATGNAGMLPLLQVAGIDSVDITFSGKKKWHMYQRYQYYVQQRFLKRAKERDDNTVRGCTFDYQASKLTLKKGIKTVYKQIHHENENDLDDTQDATVGVIHLIENPDLSSLSYAIVKHKGAVSEQHEKEPEDGEEKDKRLEGQYVPSFMDRKELGNWMDRREDQMR